MTKFATGKSASRPSALPLPEEAESLRRAIGKVEEQRSCLGDEVSNTLLECLENRLRAIGYVEEHKKRKYVTVVFADVTGFTAICEKHDAEYVTGLINTLWNALDSVILDHGGIIDKHVGDGVMAVWGAEKVREDDTSRAIRAALRMQECAEGITFDERKGISGFSMRVGVHSGPAFLGSIGLKGEYTAMGDTVNIASRLQSSAPSGSVIVSQETYRNVKDEFTFESRDPVSVRGLEEPLRTWVVVSSYPRRFQKLTTGVLGMETPLVGRDEEMDHLTGIAKETVERRRPRMVTICGEAGIGKSRLLHEFRSRFEDSEDNTVFFNARCTPEMMHVPCAVFRDILRFRMNVLEDDGHTEVHRKLITGMGRYLTDEESLLACHYAGFDFSDSEPVRRLQGTSALGAEGSAALIGYFRGTAEDSMTLMYLEDLHWADSVSMDMVERIMREVTRGSLLVLSLARPPLFEMRPQWGYGLPHEVMRLDPLDPGQSRRLADDILSRVRGIPDAMIRKVTVSSEGNPFYLEELIEMLADRGMIAGRDGELHFDEDVLTGFSVPSTLSGVLNARLDSIPDTEKDLLQKASVIGRIFWERVLSRLYEEEYAEHVPEYLKSVERRDLICASDDSTFQRSTEYLFRHAILRDVTYDTVLLDLRRSYHRKTADWILEQSGDRSLEFSGLIAEHLFRGEEWDRAMDWLIMAGDSAFSTSSYNEALFSYERALEIMPKGMDPEKLARLHLMTGRALDRLARYDEACDNLQKTLDLAGNNDMPALAADALLGMTWIAGLRGEIEKMQDLGRRACDEAMRSDDRSIQALAIMRMADLDPDRDYENQMSYYRRSYRIYNELQDTGGIAITTLNMGNIATACQRYDDAEAFYRESIEAYRNLGNRWGIANCLGNLGGIESSRNHHEEARRLHAESLKISQKIGDMEGVVICNLNLGRDEIGLGNPDKGMEHNFSALDKAVAVGLFPLALAAVYELSRIYADSGAYEDAALGLLYVNHNRRAFLEESDEIDIEAELEAVTSRMPGSMIDDLESFAASASIQEMATRLLQGRT